MNINQYLKDNPRPCKYGAPMGAQSWRGHKDGAYKFYLQLLELEDGCYSLDGTYWGGPADLYCAMYIGEQSVRMFVRAPSREAAKQKVLDEYPNATFYR